MAWSRQEFHPLRVAAVDRLCDDAVAVTFDVPDELAERYAFRPGQSLTCAAVDGARSAGRTRSARRRAPRRGSACARCPAGCCSPGWSTSVRAGDVVEVRRRAGVHARPRRGGRHVLVAAGSGITPVLSIAASLLRDPAASVTLLYGNRRADTVMFAEELADLKDRYPARLRARPRAVPRAARSRAVQRPARRRPAAHAA